MKTCSNVNPGSQLRSSYTEVLRFLCVHLIALPHIHVSAAYRSHIYENFDTPRSEPYFARATYVPRTRDVRGVSVTYLYSYGISLSYVRCIKAYVLRTYGV